MTELKWKDKFIQIMRERDAKSPTHFTVLSTAQYNSLLEEVLEAKSSNKKTTLQYRRIKRFDIIEMNGIKKLIAKSIENDIRYYLPIDEVFDAIDAAHRAVGHGGRDRLLSETSKKYANITKEMINVFLSMCETCHMKRTKRKRGLVSQPILHKEMNSRCQVDLIDMQSQCDADKKFIMVYQDHLTKYVILRALQSKRAEEVAYHLVDIFTMFGAPCILHSDNGREFANKVIIELTELWPELKLVHGKRRHSQSQGSVERANQDIENMIATWLKDNNTLKWTEGLRFVQFMKNRALHSGISMSPYKALFGIEPRVGLLTTKLSNEVINDLHTEEDLEKVILSTTVSETESEQQEENVNEVDAESMQANLQTEIDEVDSNTENQIRMVNIAAVRDSASLSLEKQAKRMKQSSDKLHPPANIGDNVTVPIPDVDRARGSLRNVMAVVLTVTDDHLYKLGTKDGVLKQLYARSEFEICKENFISLEEVDQDKTISLRAAAAHSSGKNQGYIRCQCSKHCGTNACMCKRRKILCNSKSHKSSSCRNK